MSVFDIFGDRANVLAPSKPKNVSRIPLGKIGNENLGKIGSHSLATPIKLNVPVKSEFKKSFVVNKGTALQSTPLRPGTPFGKANLNTINKQPFQIYSDAKEKENIQCDIDPAIEFNKPKVIYDNDNRDMFDDIPLFSYPEPVMSPHPATPEPDIEVEHHMSFNYSYEDDFFKDDFSNDSINIEDLGLPSF